MLKASPSGSKAASLPTVELHCWSPLLLHCWPASARLNIIRKPINKRRTRVSVIIVVRGLLGLDWGWPSITEAGYSNDFLTSRRLKLGMTFDAGNQNKKKRTEAQQCGSRVGGSRLITDKQLVGQQDFWVFFLLSSVQHAIYFLILGILSAVALAAL